jgi:deoxycytidylate deaminase
LTKIPLWTSPHLAWSAKCPEPRVSCLNDAKNEPPGKNKRTNKDMVCGLVVSNQLVHIGVSSTSPGARLKTGGGQQQDQSLTRHAEMDALRYLRRHPDVRKASLVVGRFSQSTDEREKGAATTFGNSRPCLQCIRRILRFHSNVVAVTFYEEGRWVTQSPEMCATSSKLSYAERSRCHY